MDGQKIDEQYINFKTGKRIDYNESDLTCTYQYTDVT